MATSFFGKFTPSRTQCNQRPKINIQNIREYIGPSTIMLLQSFVVVVVKVIIDN